MTSELGSSIRESYCPLTSYSQDSFEKTLVKLGSDASRLECLQVFLSEIKSSPDIFEVDVRLHSAHFGREAELRFGVFAFVS